ncbi:MAG: hypothetical protein L0Z50_38515 [Verrucomicrobiales bacterium]|nr:hypothetical protein [Verrucomicrobiales bacterium]
MQNDKPNEIQVRKSAVKAIVIEIRVSNDSSATRFVFDGGSEFQGGHVSDNFEDDMENKVRRYQQ